ncbi:MAG: hypothetical protein AMXMBFR13_40590 [Phycisphaerae bacterium]
MLNALTVDLEDWGVSVLDPRCRVTDRVAVNTERILNFLAARGVRATFFALGRVCEAFPDLLPAIRDAGHEIASHGYGHELVYRLTPEQFARDLRLSSQIIESQSGRRPAGYRAPAFSITRQALWAGRILSEQGFSYSSSIFPINGRRYGIPDAPRFPHRWPDCDLMEFPLTTFQIAGHNLPACGGGYTRLFPAAVLRAAIQSANRQGQPAVIYLHPYELAPGETDWFRRNRFAFSWKRRLTQELWRSKVEQRLTQLLETFPFGPMAECLRGLQPMSGSPAARRATPVPLLTG